MFDFISMVLDFDIHTKSYKFMTHAYNWNRFLIPYVSYEVLNIINRLINTLKKFLCAPQL